jgi:hypothetical protein
MPPSLIHQPIASLPLYQLGFSRGRDVEALFALHALTGEIARQDEQAARQQQRGGPHSLVTGRHEYASAVLLDVAKVLASRFRQ